MSETWSIPRYPNPSVTVSPTCTVQNSSSCTKVHSVIDDSESVPRRDIFSPRETSPTPSLSRASIRKAPTFAVSFFTEAGSYLRLMDLFYRSHLGLTALQDLYRELETNISRTWHPSVIESPTCKHSFLAETHFLHDAPTGFGKFARLHCC